VSLRNGARESDGPFKKWRPTSRSVAHDARLQVR